MGIFEEVSGPFVGCFFVRNPFAREKIIIPEILNPKWHLIRFSKKSLGSQFGFPKNLDLDFRNSRDFLKSQTNPGN